MKYSVVIPTYNHCDDFLKPCIESIAQYSDLPDIELIVSANGLQDDICARVAEKWAVHTSATCTSGTVTVSVR